MMKKNYKIMFSAALVTLLMAGCGSTESKNIKQISASGNSLNQYTKIGVTSIAEQNVSTPTQSSTDPLILNIVDGDTIHLIAKEGSFDLNGTIVSYEWTDMDDNVLSQTKELNRTLYYDENYDLDHSGITKYIKTITLRDDQGQSASKSYTVYVHKDALENPQALLGPLSLAHFTLTKLHDTTPIAEGTTTQGNGTNVNTAGVIPISADILNGLEDGYYLMKVSGGKDIDRDDDLVWDTNPTVNKGTLYAILTAQQLKSANYKVNIFTYGVYAFLQEAQILDGLSDEELTQKLDDLAREVIAVDLDGNNEINYSDILHWNPVTDKEKLTVDYATKVLPLVNQILGADAQLPVIHESKSVLDTKLEAGSLHKYLYDESGDVVTEEIDDNNDGTYDHNKTYRYDQFHHVVEEIDSDGNSIIYTNTYDLQGHMIEQRDNQSSAIDRWIYDEQGVLIEHQYDRFGDGSAINHYYYINGKLDHATLEHADFTSTLKYETDQYGNVTKSTWNALGNSEVTTFTYLYDEAGHILQKTSNGESVFIQTWKQINVVTQ